MKAASIHQLYFLWCVKTLCPRFGPRCIISLLWAAWHAAQTWLVVCSEDHLQFQELQGLPAEEACHYTVTRKKSVELLQKNIKKTSLLWKACKPFLRAHRDENKETVQHIPGCRSYLKPCSRLRLQSGTFSRWGNAPQGGAEAPTSNVLLCDLISSWWVGTSLNARFSPLLGDGYLIKFMKLLSLGTRQINKPTLFRPNSSSSEEKKKKGNKNLDWKGFDALCGS